MFGCKRLARIWAEKQSCAQPLASPHSFRKARRDAGGFELPRYSQLFRTPPVSFFMARLRAVH
jgi:hypothetical protein